jgi:hypothetical protein
MAIVAIKPGHTLTRRKFTPIARPTWRFKCRADRIRRRLPRNGRQDSQATLRKTFSAPKATDKLAS